MRMYFLCRKREKEDNLSLQMTFFPSPKGYIIMRDYFWRSKQKLSNVSESSISLHTTYNMHSLHNLNFFRELWILVYLNIIKSFITYLKISPKKSHFLIEPLRAHSLVYYWFEEFEVFYRCDFFGQYSNRVNTEPRINRRTLLYYLSKPKSKQ